jgi:hypothetical protein
MIPFETFHAIAFIKNVTRSTLFWLAGIALLGLTTCQQGMELEKELTFPAKFVHAGFELGPSTYYEVEADDFREISDKGRLAPFDSGILKASEDLFLLLAPVEVMLLSDSTTRVSHYNFPEADSILSEETTYRTEGDHLFIEYQGQDVFELIKNDEFDQLKMPAYSELNTYYGDIFQRRELSPLATSLEILSDYPESILDLYRDKEIVKVGDTIAVNRSFFVYELEVE